MISYKLLHFEAIIGEDIFINEWDYERDKASLVWWPHFTLNQESKVQFDACKRLTGHYFHQLFWHFEALEPIKKED